jgi:hypothetical protein
MEKKKVLMKLSGFLFAFWLSITSFEAQSRNRDTISVQPENKTEACSVRVPPGSVNLPYLFKFEWDGDCDDGFAHGKGSLTSYYKGKLNGQEIGLLKRGFRDGRTITVNLSVNDVGYKGITITHWRNGYVCGTMEEYDGAGKRMGAGEGDCKGNIRQTSNPWDYFLQGLPGPGWQTRMVYKFLFNLDGQYQANFSNCMNQFKQQGFSESVALKWCSLNF